MKASIDHLLYLIKQVGVEKALQGIDIESIEDPDDPMEKNSIRIICRTIKYSCEELERVLIDRISERDAKSQKTPPNTPLNIP